jgi:WD40 repeat protein
VRHVALVLCFLAAVALSSAAVAGEPRRDLYGDALPPGAVLRLGTVRLRHTTSPRAVAFAPDGKTLASVDGANAVCLWDVNTGAEVRRFDGAKWPERVAFSPDGAMLAVGDGGGKYGVCVWKVSDGSLVARLEGEVVIEAVTFSPDGKSVAVAGREGVLRIWDIGKAQTTAKLVDSKDTVSTLAYSADGKWLAANSSGTTVNIWNVTSGKVERGLVGERGVAFWHLDLTPDGKTILSLNDEKMVRVWDVGTGKTVRKHPVSETKFVLRPDGKEFVSVDDQHALCVWDVATGKVVRRFPGWTHTLRDMAIDPAGKQLAVADHWLHAIILIDLETGKERTLAAGHQGSVADIAMTPDCRTWATTGTDGILCLWDATDGRLLKRMAAPCRFWSGMGLAPDGTTVTVGGDDGLFCRWEITSGKKVDEFRLEVHEDLSSVAFSADGKTLLVGYSNGKLVLHDAKTGKECVKLTGQHEWLTGAAVSPDGKWAASCARSGMLCLWDSATGEKLDELIRTRVEDGSVYSVRISPSGRLLASAERRIGARVWDVTRRQEVARFPNAYLRVAFSPDDRNVVTADNNGIVRVWEVASGKERVRFKGPPGTLWVAAFAGDGRSVACGGDDTAVLVWDLTGGRLADKRALTGKEREEAWQTLAGDDAAAAYGALWTLASEPRETVRSLEKQIRPVAAVTPEQLAALLRRLDHDDFDERERASAELERFGDQLESALRKKVDGLKSAEARRRVNEVLARLASRQLDGEALRDVRVVELLEQIATAGAKELLTKLAGGAEGARLTCEAKAALARLPR